jgi:hypothetical protein
MSRLAALTRDTTQAAAQDIGPVLLNYAVVATIFSLASSSASPRCGK